MEEVVESGMMANDTEFDTDDHYGLVATGDVYVFDRNQRIVVSMLYSVIAVAGITGNACVILAVLLSKKLHTLTNILVVNLSITDLVTCLTMIVQIVVLLSSDQTLQVIPEQLCVFVSAVSFVGICSNLITLTLIAFMRWYVITRSIRGHVGLHTPQVIGVFLALVWILSLLVMLLPPGLGLGTFGYSVSYKQCCTVDDNPLVLYYSIIQGGGTFVLVALAVYFYIGIFIFVRKNNQKFTHRFSQENTNNVTETHTNTNKDQTGSKNSTNTSVRSVSYLVENQHHQSEAERRMAERFRERELRVTKNLFVVFCIFLVCLVPFSLSLAIPGGSVLNVYCAVLFYCNTCTNPVVYCLKHDQFKKVLRPMMRCRWAEIPQPTNLLIRCFPRSHNDVPLSNITSSK